MTTFRAFTSAGWVLALATSLIVLVWVYQWATHNNGGADYEHQRFVISAMIACAILAAPIAVIAVLDADRAQPLLTVLRAAATGALIATVAAAASTLLIAMAISPATDPADFGRPLFPFAYVGALIISVMMGFGAAWSATAGVRDGPMRLGSLALCLGLALVAASYLATGSSELNQCVVDHEFPLATDHVCSGY